MSDKDPDKSNITIDIQALQDTIKSIYLPLVSGDKETQELLERYVHVLDNSLSQVVGTRSISFPPSLLENQQKGNRPTSEQLEEYTDYLVSLLEIVD